MTVEYDAVYIDELDPALPESSDDISEGDDHMRLIKQTLINTFPTATTALSADFNYLNSLPSHIVLGSEANSDTDSTTVQTMDVQANRIKNIHDAKDAQDVPSLAQVQNLITQALSNGIYAVGQPYISRNPTNPAQILGFGTWVQVSGGMFGAGSFTGSDGTTTYDFLSGNKYGSVDSYLQVGNIPQINVDMGAVDGNGNPYVTTSVTAAHQHTVPMSDAGYSAGSGGGDHFPTMQGTTTTSAAGEHNHTLTGSIPIGNASPTPMSIMNPINVFYIWERTA